MININENKTKILPVLPLRGLNVYPGMLLNFDVERSISLAALNFAMNALSEDSLMYPSKVCVLAYSQMAA